MWDDARTPLISTGRERSGSTPVVAVVADLDETPVMQPLDIHHVSVNVTDVEEALAFYTGVLGGTPRTDRPDFGFGGAWIDFGGRQLHLIEAPVPANFGQHFAIRVADLQKTVNELRELGHEITDAVAVGSGRQAFIIDPSGNAIELHQTNAV